MGAGQSRVTLVAPVRFLSVAHPDLQIGPEDVDLCDDCGWMTTRGYEDARYLFGHDCLKCKGWRLVHGYDDFGHAYTAAIDSWIDGSAGEPLPSGCETGSEQQDPEKRAPLPPAA